MVLFARKTGGTDSFPCEGGWRGFRARVRRRGLFLFMDQLMLLGAFGQGSSCFGPTGRIFPCSSEMLSVFWHSRRRELWRGWSGLPEWNYSPLTWTHVIEEDKSGKYVKENVQYPKCRMGTCTGLIMGNHWSWIIFIPRRAWPPCTTLLLLTIFVFAPY